MPVYSYPSIVVFDLDYTLWPWWCDYHVQPPISIITDEQLTDAGGFTMSLFPDVNSIIRELKENGVTIIGASRTPTPHIAKKILSLMKIDGIPMKDYFASLQWGEGTKTKHIRNAVKELGLKKELDSGSAILFDDESRNRDVEKINCHFAYIDDYRNGLTREIFEQSLHRWTREQ